MVVSPLNQTNQLSKLKQNVIITGLFLVSSVTLLMAPAFTLASTVPNITTYGLSISLQVLHFLSQKHCLQEILGLFPSSSG